MKKKVVSAMMLTLLIGMLPLAFNIRTVRAEPKTWTVDDDGPADFHTIQDAINAASSGHVIEVATGTYYEHLTLGKSLTLIGENPNTTIIDGGRWGRVVTVTASGVHITNFTIQNAAQASSAGAGIGFFSSSGNVIKGNILTNNTFGIHLGSSMNNLIDGNILRGNRGCGLYVEYSHRNTIMGNTVATHSIGLLMADSSDNVVVGNRISNNSMDGIALWGNYGVRNNTIANNEIVFSPRGLFLESHTYENKISNNVISDNHYDGISLIGAGDSNLFINNTIAGSREGLSMWDSGGNVFRHNNMTGNRWSLKVSGRSISDFIQDIDTTNTVNGKPVYYLIDQQNLVINTSTFPDIGYLGLIRSKNVEVTGLTMTSNGQGILFAATNDSAISGVVVTENSWGIDLHYSYNNTIDRSSASGNGVGIWLQQSNNTSIRENTIANNGYGVALWTSGSNTLYHNNFFNNVFNNSIYHVRVMRDELANIWDDGYPSGGNYWSGYTDLDVYSGVYQNITGSDGIWDHPYVIDASNQDNYPLVEPWGGSTETFNVTKDGAPYQISTYSNSDISAFQYNSTSNEIRFDVTGPTGTTGFCTITVPNELGTGFQVFVDGVPVDHTQTENATHYFLYFTYQHSTHAITIAIQLSPPRLVERLIETIENWGLSKGTENSLTMKLEDALYLLEMDREVGAVRKLMDFTNQVEALRGKGKIEDWQADYLLAEAQRIVDLIQD